MKPPAIILILLFGIACSWYGFEQGRKSLKEDAIMWAELGWVARDCGVMHGTLMNTIHNVFDDNLEL